MFSPHLTSPHFGHLQRVLYVDGSYADNLDDGGINFLNNNTTGGNFVRLNNGWVVRAIGDDINKPVPVLNLLAQDEANFRPAFRTKIKKRE